MSSKVMEENTPHKKVEPWSHWFEIPVLDFDRARKFYEAIFQIKLHVEDFGGLKMGVFPHSEGGGAICKGEYYLPGPHGPVVYLNAGPDLQLVQDRIAPAGGTVVMRKKQISAAHGYMALFMDSEGNRLALHSME
jgi:uncharacterized protein